MYCWRPLVIVSGQYPDLAEHLGADAAGNGEAVQRYMTWAPDNPVSIRSSIRAAREGARSIREVIGHDIWEATNELYLWFMSEGAAAQYLHDRDEVYRHVRRSTQLCLGLVRSTMLHDEPMDFLWLGVMLERIGQTARTLDMHHHIRSVGRADAAAAAADGALAVAAARLLRVRGLHAQPAGPRQRRGGDRLPAVRGALPALAALLPDPCWRWSCRLAPDGATAASPRPTSRLDALDRWLDDQEKSGGRPPTTRCSRTSSTRPAPPAALLQRSLGGKDPEQSLPLPEAAQAQ